MSRETELSKEAVWGKLLDRLIRARAPLFMDGELKGVSEEIHELEGRGALVARGGMRVHGYVYGDYRDLSPRDPLTGAVYGFTEKSDASAWARKLKEHPRVRGVTIC